jgi:hypothetical protein
MFRRASRSATAFAIVASATAAVPVGAASASPDEPVNRVPDAATTVRVDPEAVGGGDVPDHFVGVSIEWTLIDRYMGPGARPGFVNLLRNLGSGLLRIGGSSQDQVPFSATVPDSDRFVTPQDLTWIRTTLDLVNAKGPQTPDWVTVLGTALAPATAAFPWRGVDHAAAFVREGVAPVFGDDAGRREVAGIAFGNEPDLTYSGDIARYLSDFALYANAEPSTQWPRLVPASSENIGTWQTIRDRTINTRWFWDWPTVLDSVAPVLKAKVGVLGPFATDHFYPLARTCASDPYRCPSIARLLAQERMDSFDYEVFLHATEAARRGLRYRMDETNTAAGRGAPGVSDVAASGTWTLDTLFHAACPQPPDQPGANVDCHLGATGINVHNAEVRAYFFPQEGNAYYNAIRYDPTDAAGPPTAAPSYYALLLFARLAQGTSGLHPLTLDAAAPVEAWQVRSGPSERRVFLINKGDSAVVINVQTPPALAAIDRLTPYDATGAGRTLDAPEMRIDGQAVGVDGAFSGLAPTHATVLGGQLPVTIAPGEAVSITLHDYAETVRAVDVQASVPATLSLSLGGAASFGTFSPGVDRSYEAGTAATVISTAGEATLAITDPSATATGRLANGSSALTEPLQARAGSGTFTPLSSTASTPLTLLTYSRPVSNEPTTIAFRQHISAHDALRTGNYSKTLTLSLMTTTP